MPFVYGRPLADFTIDQVVVWQFKSGPFNLPICRRISLLINGNLVMVVSQALRLIQFIHFQDTGSCSAADYCKPTWMPWYSTKTLVRRIQPCFVPNCFTRMEMVKWHFRPFTHKWKIFKWSGLTDGDCCSPVGKASMDHGTDITR